MTATTKQRGAIDQRVDQFKRGEVNFVSLARTNNNALVIQSTPRLITDLTCDETRRTTPPS